MSWLGRLLHIDEAPTAIRAESELYRVFDELERSIRKTEQAAKINRQAIARKLSGVNDDDASH